MTENALVSPENIFLILLAPPKSFDTIAELVIPFPLLEENIAVIDSTEKNDLIKPSKEVNISLTSVLKVVKT